MAWQHTGWQWEPVFVQHSLLMAGWRGGVGWAWWSRYGGVGFCVLLSLTSFGCDEVFSPCEGNEHRHIQLKQEFSREIAM